MKTRFPKCVECSSPIDPINDKYRIVNAEEAKYGRSPEYAHKVCPAKVSEDAEGEAELALPDPAEQPFEAAAESDGYDVLNGKH